MFKDSIIYMVGEVSSKIIPFILLPYLVRELGPTEYGELANIQAYIVLATIFVAISQEGAVSRYYYVYGKRSVNLIVISGYIFSTIITMALIAFSYLTENIIISYVGVTALAQTLLSVQLILRQCQKKALYYVVIQLASCILMLVTTIILFEIFESTYENRLLAIIIGNSISFLMSFCFYERKLLFFSLKNYKKGVIYLLAFGFPLILHNLSFFLKGHFDRIIIYKSFSPDELSIYAIAFQIASVISVIIIAANKAFIPYLYKGFKENRISYQDLMKIYKTSFAFIPIPALFVLIIPEKAFNLLLGDGFSGVKYFTVFFSFGLSFSIPYLIMINYLFYNKLNKEIAISSLISSIIYVLILLIMMPLGLEYLPFALVFSNIIIIALLKYFSEKHYRKFELINEKVVDEK